MVSQETDAITSDCNNVLDLLQAVTVKAPRVAAAPLSLRMGKRMREWFCCCSTHHISPLSTTSPPHHETTQDSQKS